MSNDKKTGRLIEVRNDYYAKKAYNSSLELHDLGQRNWCTYVKAILNETQLQQAWVNQSIDNRRFAMLKESLHRSYMAECIRNVHDFTIYPKVRTYKLFKDFKITFHLQNS